MNLTNKFIVLTAVAALMISATIVAIGDEAFGGGDRTRNIGDRNVGQQNTGETNAGSNTIGGDGDDAHQGDRTRNIGDRNVGQQNCNDTEAINNDTGDGSGEANGGNFVGGDLNINNDN
jgi:hypothetical protein